MTTHATKIPLKIDFHANAILPTYVDALKILKIDAKAEEGFPLPAWNVENSIDEFNFTINNLDALGVKLPTNANGIYLGDERLDPIFDALNQKNSLIIVHPSPARELPRENVVTGKVMALFEYPTDTTRAFLNILANNTLEKFPNIKFIVQHCGSFLPYMKQRADSMFKMLAAMNSRLARENLRRKRKIFTRRLNNEENFSYLRSDFRACW